MIALAWYLLKAAIVSSILCAYYYIALKDKVFHKWNRFFLLATVIISIILPLVSIPVFQMTGDQGAAISALQSFTIQDEIVIEMGRQRSMMNSDWLIYSLYIAISFILLFSLLHSLFRIRNLRRKFPVSKVEGIEFINTSSDGTPFTFFNSVFWNASIDLNTVTGQQIFHHELAHIREKHSYDKLFMNIVLLFLWINPFFWLIKKELHIIHEFVADQLSLKDGDTRAFAEMVLSSVYTKRQFTLTNHFFHSPIKRRLMMLKKSKNPKVNYLSRLLVLPLATLIFIGISCKVKSNSEGTNPQDSSAIASSQSQQGSPLNSDTMPAASQNKKIVSLEVVTPEGKAFADIKYADGSTERITLEEAEKRGISIPPPPPPPGIASVKLLGQDQVELKFSDGSKRKMSLKEAKAKGISVPPPPPVPIITSTPPPVPTVPPPPVGKPRVSVKKYIPPKVVKDDLIYTKVDKEASFPGGPDAWRDYITSAITKALPQFSEKDVGTCIVRFVVDQDGDVSDVTAPTWGHF